MENSWEQPAFEDGLDAIAVDLITAKVQEVFASLDPVALVASARPELGESERLVVADLIDHAVVEVVVEFAGPS